VVGYFDPSVSRQFREIVLSEEKTLQGILLDTLNDFFAKKEGSQRLLETSSVLPISYQNRLELTEKDFLLF